MDYTRRLLRSLLLSFSSLLLSYPSLSYGAGFTVEDGQVVGAQILPDLQDKGYVEEGGTINTSTNGISGVGVLMLNGLQELTNDGNILTTGSLSGLAPNGVTAFGPSSLITNNGFIHTTGGGASGIAIGSTSTGSTVINNGLILIEGNQTNSDGIRTVSTGSTILNNGVIRTTGTTCSGILVGSPSIQTADANIKNSGLIESTGIGSFGVRFLGTNSNSTLTNNGTIIANNDPTSFAIALDGVNLTLNLQRESNIQGAVRISNPSTLNVQKGLNLALTTSGVSSFTTITTEGSLLATQGNLIAVVDRSGFALEVDILDDLTASIMNNLGRQYCIECCENEFCNDWSYWVRGFGSFRERGLQKRSVKYNNGLEGGMAGIEKSLSTDCILGAFGGGSYGTSHVKHNSHTFRNTSGFGGFYIDGSFYKNFFRLALSGGSLDQRSRRKVMNNLAEGGIQHARAKLKGGWVAPELRIARTFCVGELQPIVSADVRYSGLFLGTYKEKASTTNFHIKEHQIHLLTTAGEIAIPLSYDICNSCLTLTPYAGLEGRFRIGKKKLHGELLDQSITFYDGSWNEIGIAFIGVRTCQKLDCGLDIMIDLEGDFDNKKSALIRGGLKAEMAF